MPSQSFLSKRFKRMLKLAELGVRRSFLGVLRLAAKAKRRKGAAIDPSTIRSILLLRQDRLGDAIITTPLLVALRERFPLAEITMLLGGNNRAIAPMLPIDCKTVVYEKNLSKDFAMLGVLRRKKIDVLIDLTDNASATSSILISLIRPTWAIGIEKENAVVYDVLVPCPDRSLVHISRRIAELLRPLGIDPEGIDLRPKLTLPNFDVVEGRIGINISAGSDSRRAPASTYAAIAGSIAARYAEVAILAEPKDYPKAREIEKLSGVANVKAHQPSSSFAEFGATLGSCEMLITPDTSVVHLGAAAGVPMVVIYAPIPDGLHYWTPTGVPYEMMVQRPSLESLEPAAVLELFNALEAKVQTDPLRPVGHANATSSRSVT